MSPLSESSPESTSTKRSAFERAIESLVVMVGHAAMGIALLGMGWLVLASIGHLATPGLWLWEWANPQRSPLGPWGAVLVVWPAAGLGGLLVQGLVEGACHLIGRAFKRAQTGLVSRSNK
jgi:hypothetical protein